jgi:hypothetical protein
VAEGFRGFSPAWWGKPGKAEQLTSSWPGRREKALLALDWLSPFSSFSPRPCDTTIHIQGGFFLPQLILFGNVLTDTPRGMPDPHPRYF